MERVEDQIARLTARVDDLTVRLEQLTARVDDLTARMERVEDQIARLAARMEQLTARVDDLTVRMEQLTARVDDLAAAQVRTEQRLEQLIARVDAMERDLSNLRSEFRGYRLEWRYLQRPSGYFGPLLRRLRLVWPSEAVDRFDDQLPRWAAEELLRADLLVTGEPRYQPDIGEVWLVVEISARIDRNDVERALRRAEALRRAGLRVLPAVAGERTTQGAKNAVREHQVVLFQDGFVEGWEEALRSWAG
jgi:prefoldin subunit 5